MVANKIYTTTHDGLTQLVSARVASQVLDSGLRTAKCSAETVSAKQMGRVLKGPVLKELATILPRAGLERSIEKLLKTLKTLPPAAVEAAKAKAAEVAPTDAVPGDAASTYAVPGDAVPGDAVPGDVLLNDTPVGADANPVVDPAPGTAPGTALGTALGAALGTAAVQRAASGTATPDAAPEQAPFTPRDLAAAEPPSRARSGGERLVAVSAAAPSVAQGPTAEASQTWPAPVTLGPAARDSALLALARLEHVAMVAAFEGGGVSAVRGSGFEVEALSRLGTLGLKLLSRSGELRTFYVAHSRGQLFLFPFGEVTLMLIGSGELNLGLVFATLQKFKEEL